MRHRTAAIREGRAVQSTVEREPRILNDRQIYIPATDPFDQLTVKKVRGGWAPEIHQQGDLRFFFHLSLHYLTVFESAIALQDQSLPITVRHFRAGVFERLDLPHQLVTHQQIVRVEVLKEYASGDRRSGGTSPACPD